ncbi:MAG TPA: response regulator, partial [Phycisphaerales bacterium]|nr:response regulator [Phycisphaerales bacterium]
VPIIMLTATDDPQTIDRCYELGCSTYMVKLAENDDLEESIKKIGHFLSVVEIASIE